MVASAEIPEPFRAQLAEGHGLGNIPDSVVDDVFAADSVGGCWLMLANTAARFKNVKPRGDRSDFAR
jgi:hypothetical protein